jgi:rSAM/selenodomain-associated transferase 1
LSAPSVLVIARAPRPGEAQARLEPLLGPQGCARLQAALIARAVAWAGEIGARAWVAHAPADAAEEVAACAPGATVFAQEDGDRGARLAAAARRVFAESDGPLLTIGTDLPTLQPRHAEAALDDLAEGCDVSIGPAARGGYYLIAMRSLHPEVFALPADAWGGPRVFELTLAAAHAAGLALGMLRLEVDLGTPSDARWLLLDRALPADVAEILREVGERAPD